MASFVSSHGLILVALSLSLLPFNLEAVSVPNVQSPELQFKDHGGPLLNGHISVNLIWYGKFSPAQRVIVSEFITSFSKPTTIQPSVYSWLNLTHKFYQKAKIPFTVALLPGPEILDENYSLGKSLTMQQIVELASKGGKDNVINVVLTSADVTVEGFCSRCGTHASVTQPSKFNYIWVGNSETQCPGVCAWPFHQASNGPNNPVLISPNKDVAVDGMITNLAGFLVGTLTNPSGDGFYQGTKESCVEATAACAGSFGSGAYPGFPGNLPIDPTTGAGFNALGFNGKKYLLPAIMDPETLICATPF